MLRRVAIVRTEALRLLHQGDLVFLGSMRRLLVTASVFPSSPILIAMMNEGLSSFEKLAFTRGIPRNIPEDAILHSHRPECLKSCKSSFNWTCSTGQHVILTHFSFCFGDGVATLQNIDGLTSNVS
jgi:hypothetical protein